MRQASARGLTLLALTDHDTTLGLEEAIDAGERFGVRVIPGIELSTDVREGEIHILGYGIDRGSRVLQDTLARLRDARAARMGRILARLRALGIEVDQSLVQPSASGASAGRAHVARALVAAGHVASVSEAFDRYLGQGKPAYVASERLRPEAAIQLVVRSGGIPVFAHPFTFAAFRERLPAMIAAGLQGIEVYYGEYGTERRAKLAAIARHHGLLATGGSDYHGEGFREGRSLGSVEIPRDALVAFLERVDARQTHV
jgi:predicted metal-dependent phosphoesterase TrpH